MTASIVFSHIACIVVVWLTDYSSTELSLEVKEFKNSCMDLNVILTTLGNLFGLGVLIAWVTFFYDIS